MKKALIESYKCFFSGTPGRFPYYHRVDEHPTYGLENSFDGFPQTS
jgi:hypothetical protein